MSNPQVWLEDARNGTPVGELIKRFQREVETDLGWLPMWLMYADRWADINRLREHANSLIANGAKTEWYWRNELTRERRADDQRKAAYTGDGMGLAYFTFDGDQPDTEVQVVKVINPKLVSVFEQYGIYQGAETTLSVLKDALLDFCFRENLCIRECAALGA